VSSSGQSALSNSIRTAYITYLLAYLLLTIAFLNLGTPNLSRSFLEYLKIKEIYTQESNRFLSDNTIHPNKEFGQYKTIESDNECYFNKNCRTLLYPIKFSQKGSDKSQSLRCTLAIPQISTVNLRQVVFFDYGQYDLIAHNEKKMRPLDELSTDQLTYLLNIRKFTINLGHNYNDNYFSFPILLGTKDAKNQIQFASKFYQPDSKASPNSDTLKDIEIVDVLENKFAQTESKLLYDSALKNTKFVIEAFDSQYILDFSESNFFRDAPLKPIPMNKPETFPDLFDSKIRASVIFPCIKNINLDDSEKEIALEQIEFLLEIPSKRTKKLFGLNVPNFLEHLSFGQEIRFDYLVENTFQRQFPSLFDFHKKSGIGNIGALVEYLAFKKSTQKYFDFFGINWSSFELIYLSPLLALFSGLYLIVIIQTIKTRTQHHLDIKDKIEWIGMYPEVSSRVFNVLILFFWPGLTGILLSIFYFQQLTIDPDFINGIYFILCAMLPIMSLFAFLSLCRLWRIIDTPSPAHEG